MHVIPHQAVPRDSERRSPAMLRQQAKIHHAVGLVKEDGLLPVPALRDVMPASRHHHARHSSHGN